MQRRFLFFVNPISGTKGKEGLKSLIAKEMNAAGVEWEIQDTRANADYGFVRAYIIQNAITDVIVCGGDGSVSGVAGSLRDVDVNVGIIPMGSGNGLALAAKIPRNPRKALRVVLNGRASYIDSFLINGQFSCMLCGMGLDAEVAHNFSKRKKRGLSTYIQEIIKVFPIPHSYNFRLKINSIEAEYKAIFITVSNSNQFGNHFTIAPKASLTDGLLDIVVVKKMNSFRLFRAVLEQVRRGRPESVSLADMKEKRVSYFQADALTIYNPDSAPLHIDGEPS